MGLILVDTKAIDELKQAIHDFYGIEAHGKLKKEASEAIIERANKLKAEINGRN